MQAVILAAGAGSRLLNLTQSRSKAMLPIAGLPLVERVMTSISACSIEEFILVIRPDDTEIVTHFNRHSRLGAQNAQIQFAVQNQARGTAHALSIAAPFIKGEFIMSACDNLVSNNHLLHIVQSWLENPHIDAILSLMNVNRSQVSKTAIVTMDQLWVTSIIEKPSRENAPSTIASLPLYLFSPRILDYLTQVNRSPRGELEIQDAIRGLISDQGKVLGVMTDNRKTVTTPKDFLDINIHYLQNRLFEQKAQENCMPTVENLRIIPPVLIYQPATIGDGCSLGPNVFIEENTVIGDNSQIDNAVVLRGSHLPKQSSVSHQVIGNSPKVIADRHLPIDICR